MVDLKANPFYLNDEQIAWVEKTRSAMTDDEKAEQLLCPLMFTDDEEELKSIISTHNFGAVMFRSGVAEKVQRNLNAMQKVAKIPLLIAANLENGGDGVANEGTSMGNQMMVAATDNEERAYQLGKICGREGSALGFNWSFAPVLDIDMNYHNPITNVRTYGSDYTRTIRMGRQYIKGLTEEGIAPCIKHFPGDGVDERDQHLLTSVNTLSIDEWEATYGQIYRTMINEGALTAMIGHIAMPAMEEAVSGQPCNEVIPASCSKNILSGYLRGKLGFNGLVSTDASPMVGFLSNSVRREAVPLCIEYGCDILLFNKDLEEDLMYMKEGIKNGLLSRERLEDAVTRILATKAALNLHTKHADGSICNGPEQMKQIACEEHLAWARGCADEGITLVKNVQNILPLSPAKTKKVLLEILGDFASNERVQKQVVDILEKEGFDVTVYVPETFETIFLNQAVEDFKKKYDLVLYVANIETASNKTVSRINWHTLFGAGNNLPWFVKEVPTVFVSFGNPYHLLDAPMIKTFVNSYSNAPHIVDMTFDKLFGKSEFKGKSPVDAFCGRWDTRL
ncbi:MAG: glycoside hydrolase family 3 protein [Agathobacter sp.]|uniref:glycoside hydrolase family 3 protein n=1 Tax=Agathobacter sp. TaxID=2021311 RepID=UPI00257AAEAC|nr:glycoside hydrolase family 3 N-terminal domain-containing protein [Agathobacter sp.]MBQ1680714.1 glycoside hydrolase family 3 protein [Agathobacter sp.]